MRLSIRMKFLLVMSGLLMVCLGFYLLMSITVFKSDKTRLVYDLNKSQVSNLAGEIETRLRGVSDTMNLFAQLSSEQQNRLMEQIFSKESDLISLQIFKNDRKSHEKIFTKKTYLETYGLDEQSFQEKTSSVSVPFEKILSQGEAIWNGSAEGVPPLIAYGKLVLVLDENETPVDQWILLAHLKLDAFLKSVSLLNLSDIQITNKDGDVLIQRDAEALIQHPNIKDSGLFSKALGSTAKLSVTQIEIDGKGWLSAFAKAFDNQLVVTAKVPEKKVFRVVQSLTVRTLLFGSIVLTLVILAAFLLSRTLTENIALLSQRMTEASQGDLTSVLKLKGRDETVKLGHAFNQMIFDLKKSRDELEVMNRELDQKVKDRTHQLEIQNQKVAEAQEALLRTARMASMGEVAGRTAHEVLNPLTSLLTRAGLTQKRVEDSYQESLELLNEICQAWQQDYQDGGFDQLVKNWQAPSEIDDQKNLFAEDMGNITDIRQSLKTQANEISRDMLFIREEGNRIGKIIHGMRRLGHMKSEVRELSIHKLLTDSCYIMADLFDQQKMKIVQEFKASKDLVKLDRDEFIQAVTNMMRNSLQSLVFARRTDRSREGYLKITTYEKHGNIEVFIEDNGLGIEAKDQERLFEKDFTTKSSDEGTGLGLSISRRFIRAYDGDIDLELSEPMQKTVFKIILPLSSVESQRKDVA